MRTAVLASLAVLLAGCSTPYGKYGALGGYTDSRIDANTFSISVDNNGFTSQQTTSMHAMYRASELTVENGFDYFVIASGTSNPTSMAMAMPSSSTSTTTLNAYGSTATTTQYAPVTVVPVVFPNSTLIIKSFKGTKPTDQANAYDAREVMKYLGPQIGVSPIK
jgi:hypothetical protein